MFSRMKLKIWKMFERESTKHSQRFEHKDQIWSQWSGRDPWNNLKVSRLSVNIKFWSPFAFSKRWCAFKVSCQNEQQIGGPGYYITIMTTTMSTTIKPGREKPSGYAINKNGFLAPLLHQVPGKKGWLFLRKYHMCRAHCALVRFMNPPDSLKKLL